MDTVFLDIGFVLCFKNCKDNQFKVIHLAKHHTFFSMKTHEKDK